ncbi:hypothetical protein NQ317_006188 [Molorchus minor]|uniref:MADF domain-containing protein n=1 Tax=Molorchus minor TaxID=1323400 RepID=A0ABQ9IWR2_9CUCU|nr:hypothetical protein NQ317_006188 [Molorchus minor]
MEEEHDDDDDVAVWVDDCIRVWKNIRDKYTRERKIAISQPANQQYLSKWDFYDAMEFLSPFIRSRRSLRKSKGFCKKQQEPNDSSDHFSPSSNSKLWDPISVKLSPSLCPFLRKNLTIQLQEIEDVTTFESNVVNSTSTRVKEIAQPSTISIVRHQTSEEAFGAYIATRLMEFPPEIRQIKKAKLFKDLEEPEEVFSDYVK